MKLRFSTLAAKFIKWATKCRSPITVNVYHHYFRKFLEEVGDVDAAKLRPYQLTAWAKTWHASQAIVRLYRWAIEDAGLLRTNPLERVKHPPKGMRCRIATAHEQARLLRRAAHDVRALLLAYRESMARPGELRAACWEDLYPKTTPAKLCEALRAGLGLIVLRDYKSRKRRRLPNEPRTILISPRMGRLLARLIERGGRGMSHIFTTSAGRSWTANALRCRMRRLRTSLNLTPDTRGENLVPYTFRHTGATLATAAGLRDRVLADALGHTETATTARYQHLQVAHIRDALRTFWAKRRQA